MQFLQHQTSSKSEKKYMFIVIFPKKSPQNFPFHALCAVLTTQVELFSLKVRKKI